MANSVVTQFLGRESLGPPIELFVEFVSALGEALKELSLPCIQIETADPFIGGFYELYDLPDADSENSRLNGPAYLGLWSIFAVFAELISSGKTSGRWSSVGEFMDYLNRVGGKNIRAIAQILSHRFDSTQAERDLSYADNLEPFGRDFIERWVAKEASFVHGEGESHGRRTRPPSVAAAN